MKGLVNNLPADQVKYHAVSGISGGAVNAAIMGAFAPGQEKEAADRMEQFWRDAGNTKLY
jgi:predicted acylesterase/phospholipase RssA